MWDDLEPASWVGPSTVKLEVGRIVQNYFGDNFSITALPGDGTIEIKPKRGESFPVKITAFNTNYLVKAQ